MKYEDMVEKLAAEILEKEAAINMKGVSKSVAGVASNVGKGVKNFGKTVSGANVKKTQGMLDNLVQGSYKRNPNMTMDQLQRRGEKLNLLNQKAVKERTKALGQIGAGVGAVGGLGVGAKLQSNKKGDIQKVASEYFKESQIIKQAASEAYLEAEAIEKAAEEALQELGYYFE